MNFSFASNNTVAALAYDSDSSDDEGSSVLSRPATVPTPSRRKQRSARKQVLFSGTGGNGHHQARQTGKVFMADRKGRPMTRKTKPTGRRISNQHQEFDHDFFKAAAVSTEAKAVPVGTGRGRGWPCFRQEKLVKIKVSHGTASPPQLGPRLATAAAATKKII